MYITVICTAAITVPDGTQLRGERELVLPSGQVVQPWIVLELDRATDLDGEAAEKLDITYEHGPATLFAVPEDSEDYITVDLEGD